MIVGVTSTYLAAEVATQPTDWESAAALVPTYAHALPAPQERVAVLGCGTSLYMARAFSTLRESAGAGLTDAWPASAARLARGYDRIIAISRSGTTTEVLEALGKYDGPAKITVITSTADSPILEYGNQILLPQFDENSVVQTRFATSVLALFRAHLGADLAPVAAQAREILAAPESDWDRVRRAEEITFVGMGLGGALAEEAALKLRESTQSWAEAYLATEYRHGPISIAQPGRVVWGLGPLEDAFVSDVSETGAHVEHHDVDPMAELVRVHRLCMLRAADRGIDPDRPRSLQRSVILES